MPSSVRAVLFDAVGTVLYPHPPPATAYYEAGRRFGSRLAAAEVARRYHIAFGRQEALDQQAGHGRTDEARETQRWRQIVIDVFDDVADGAGLFHDLWSHFASPAKWAVFPDVAAAWADLEQRGLVLGLASNFDSRLSAVCRGFEPLARCQHVFVSSSLGTRKPTAAFFTAIERALDLPASEIMLVGDSLDNDYRAALAAGWQAVHVHREDSALPTSDSIARLSELSKFVEPGRAKKWGDPRLPRPTSTLAT